MGVNRSELLTVRRQLEYYRRSYEVVKRIRDALLSEIMTSIRELEEKRSIIEHELRDLYRLYLLARGESSPGEVVGAPLGSSFIVLTEHIRYGVPRYKGEGVCRVSDVPSYSLTATWPVLDDVVERLCRLHNALAELASLEQTLFRDIELLAFYQRILNILEHIHIPRMMQRVKYLEEMLDDYERYEVTIKLVLKNMLRAQGNERA
ncbi:V-type ATP synthase subunit D [Pyrodictium abyssi]|uniref:V-type ATP synthase subunit D n=1 Tax=Pyrodictium abyssi TaxID=54256 RepID=A0ABM8IVR7_9CREN|nr:hypothetical protein PABY_12230 [Pyrodictium abyssi]